MKKKSCNGGKINKKKKQQRKKLKKFYIAMKYNIIKYSRKKKRESKVAMAEK